MNIQASIHINASPATIFQQYQAVECWHKWDKSIVEARLDGAFQAGTQGSLTPKAGPKSRFTLLEVIPNQAFTTQSNLPLCRMQFAHTLTPSTKGTQVVHQVVFEGLLSPIWGRLIGRGIKKDLPHALLGLKMLCEKVKNK